MGRTPEEYRRFARECLALAQTAEDERARATFLKMAEVWFRLAEEHAAGEDDDDSA